MSEEGMRTGFMGEDRERLAAMIKRQVLIVEDEFVNREILKAYLEPEYEVLCALDLYNTDNKNLLLDVPLASSSGFSYYTANIGTINNKGIELAVDADIYKTKDVLRADVGVVVLPGGGLCASQGLFGIRCVRCAHTYGGGRGIRTPDTEISPYGDLANRCLQPLGHPSNGKRRI